MKIYNFPQYSPEWWKIREKCLTASHAQAIGANGAGLKTYVREIMVSYYSSSTEEPYTNKTMARGLELESSAGLIYNMEFGIKTSAVGFVKSEDSVGCSPDLFAGGNGLVEIKCPEDKAYFNLLLDGKIDTKYMWQMQMQLMICEKEWCDYFVYNPNFDRHYFCERVYPDPVKFEKLNVGIASGKKLIKEIEAEIKAG